MYSGWDKEKRKGGASPRRSKHLGVSALVIGALVVIAVIFILWWLYGYHFVIVQTGETAFKAFNSSL